MGVLGDDKMEFCVDSMINQDYFDIITNLDTLETLPYYQSQDPINQLQMGTLENPYIMNWTGEDCYDWAVRTCKSLGINPVNLFGFRNVTGEEMRTFTSYDFISLTDISVGNTLYREFQDVLRRRDTVLSSPVPEITTSVQENEFQLPEGADITDLTSERGFDPELLEFLAEQTIDQQFPNGSSPLFPDEHLFIKIEDSSSGCNDEFFRQVPCSLDSQGLSPSPSSISSSPSSSPPSPAPSYVSGGNVLDKIKTTSRKRERGPKNWEYLMRMLTDEEYNPSVIRWEDEKVHTFRIVKPAVVAKIWGERSKKPNLTYDNFARGLRYHYTTGALQAVSERQLVYRCGQKALDYLKKDLGFTRSR